MSDRLPVTVIVLETNRDKRRRHYRYCWTPALLIQVTAMSDLPFLVVV
jgi:hypothetical protein